MTVREVSQDKVARLRLVHPARQSDQRHRSAPGQRRHLRLVPQPGEADRSVNAGREATTRHSTSFLKAG